MFSVFVWGLFDCMFVVVEFVVGYLCLILCVGLFVFYLNLFVCVGVYCDLSVGNCRLMLLYFNFGFCFACCWVCLLIGV